jgi:hypothetical protein
MGRAPGSTTRHPNCSRPVRIGSPLQGGTRPVGFPGLKSWAVIDSCFAVKSDNNAGRLPASGLLDVHYYRVNIQALTFFY